MLGLWALLPPGVFQLPQALSQALFPPLPLHSERVPRVLALKTFG